MTALPGLLAVMMVVHNPVDAAPDDLRLKCGPPEQRVMSLPVRPMGDSPARPLARIPPAPPREVPTEYLIDGRIVTLAEFEALDPHRIQSISVICTDETHRELGVAPETNLVLVGTYPDPAQALESRMEQITKLQETYFETHGRFAATVVDLGWHDRTGHITVELTVSPDGKQWSGTGTHTYLGESHSLAIPLPLNR